MKKKSSSFAAVLALFAVSLFSVGSAHATCTFGQISAITHGTDIISSTVLNTFAFFGQNQPPFNGGYSRALVQRWDNSSISSGVFGVAYTNQVAPNGAVTQVTTPYNLPSGSAPATNLYPNAGLKIGQLQVLVYYCN